VAKGGKDGGAHRVVEHGCEESSEHIAERGRELVARVKCDLDRLLRRGYELEAERLGCRRHR